MMRSTVGAATLVFSMSRWVALAGEHDVPSRYVVFTIDAFGVVRPQFHAVVNLASERTSRSDDELAAWLRAGSTEREHVAVRLLDATGQVVFISQPGTVGATYTDVDIPASSLHEFVYGLHGEPSSRPLGGDSPVPLAEQAFVVRVPWVLGSRLELFMGGAGANTDNIRYDTALTYMEVEATVNTNDLLVERVDGGCSRAPQLQIHAGHRRAAATTRV